MGSLKKRLTKHKKRHIKERKVSKNVSEVSIFGAKAQIKAQKTAHSLKNMIQRHKGTVLFNNSINSLAAHIYIHLTFQWSQRSQKTSHKTAQSINFRINVSKSGIASQSINVSTAERLKKYQFVLMRMIVLIGVKDLEVKNIEAALTQAGEILEREPPFKRHEKDAYSKAARSAFEYVRKARADGFSFVQICAALAKAGILPSEAHPHSLRQAFYREWRKQIRNNELSRRILSNAETEKKASPLSSKTETKELVSAAAKPKIAARGNGEDKEKDKADWLRKETGNVVNTGLGTIVKLTDGSFIYD